MFRVRRPLALLGASAFAALTAAAALGADHAGKLAVFCAIAGFCALLTACICHWKNRLPAHTGRGAFSVVRLLRSLPVLGLALVTAALFLFLHVYAWRARVVPITEELAGTEARISGTVLDYPTERNGRIYYPVRVEHVSVKGTVKDLPVFDTRLSTYLPFDCKPCDGLECTVKFFVFDDSGGVYSTRNSQLADGMILGSYLTDYERVETVPTVKRSVRRLAAELRHFLGRNFEKHLPARESALIRTMLLGEEHRVFDRDHDNYKSLGASHLLAISGLHMAVLTSFFLFLVGRLLHNRILRDLATAAFIVFFLTVIGFPASAARSGIMWLLYLAADCFGRETDSMNSLGAATLALCLGSPFCGGDLSVALSVLATLGILVLARPLAEQMLRPLRNRQKVEKILRPAALSVSMTLSALLFTLPIQAFVFRGIPLLAPLACLVLAAPCQLLLFAALGASALGAAPVLGALASPLFFCAGAMARASLWLAEKMAGLPGYFLDLSQPVWLVLTGLLLLLTAVVILERSRAVLCVFLAGAVTLCGCGAVCQWLPLRDAVTFAAVPDSSVVAVLRGDRAVVLSLGGYGAGEVEALLRRHNIHRVEALFLPDQAADVRRAASSLTYRYPVERLVLPEGAASEEEIRKAEELFLQDGGTVEVLGGVKITAEHGMERLTVEWGGKQAAVETGDTGEGACDILFTARKTTKLYSAFTVLQNGDIIEQRDLSALAALPAGQYLPAAGEGLLVDLFPDGTVALRGESACLN